MNKLEYDCPAFKITITEMSPNGFMLRETNKSTSEWTVNSFAEYSTALEYAFKLLSEWHSAELFRASQIDLQERITEKLRKASGL